MRKVFRVKFNLNKERLYNRIKVIPGTESFRAAERLYDELRLVIENNIPIRGGYCLVDKGEAVSLGSTPGDIGAICLVTAGENTVKYVSEALDNEDKSLMKGYLLDAMITESLFCASESLTDMMEELLKDKGICCTDFPGDGVINIALQRELLRMSGLGELLGVSADVYGGLYPPDSMLFVVSPGRGAKVKGRCARCKSEGCLYRNDEGIV